MSFMSQALSLAEKGRYTCMPNPMVGCVIVKNNTIIGTGAHLKAGCAHAEINALAQAGSDAQGSEVYVTLEPCSHYGRTPPCVDALIKAHVKKVYISLLDPNPLVAGRGIAQLQAAGIEVTIGACAHDAYALNKVFFYYITKKKPFVIAKWAMSLDGKISVAASQLNEANRWITSEAARAHAHQLRAQVGAIIVGENTVVIDDPDLTVRYDAAKNIIVQPRPVVLTPFGNLDHERKLFKQGRNTLVITSDQAKPSFLAMLQKNKIEYAFVALENNNHLSINETLDVLALKEISSVLVEGGARLLSSFFENGLVNEVYTYIAPKIIGGEDTLSAIIGKNILFQQLHNKKIISLDSDVCIISECDMGKK